MKLISEQRTERKLAKRKRKLEQLSNIAKKQEQKIESILDNFKTGIVAITHKDIPSYDWQEAGYSNVKWKAIKAIKEILTH